MKVVELMKIGKEILEVLQNSCIRTADVRFLAMYDEYKDMAKRSEKTSYIAMILSKKYGISERQFYYLIKRLEKDCKIGAE